MQATKIRARQRTRTSLLSKYSDGSEIKLIRKIRFLFKLSGTLTEMFVI